MSLFWYGADLHIHSALSPCASAEMAPRGIAQALREAGISIAALTDHNSCQNSEAAMVAFAAAGITPVFGMELETSEEIHLLCLFGGLSEAMAWQDYVFARLPNLAVDPRVHGEQRLFSPSGHFAGKNGRLLAVAAEITLDVAAKEVARLGGIAVPAHVDRQAYSVISVLGFLPRELPVAAVEITAHTGAAEARARFDLEGYTLVSFSDAHQLADILPARTAFLLAEPTFAEVCMALRNEAGRQAALID